MILRLTEIRLYLDEAELLLKSKAARRLDITADDILSLTIIRKGLDSRKKDKINFVYTLNVEIDDCLAEKIDLNTPHVKVAEKEGPVKFPKLRSRKGPLIAGAGPAGLFAALRMTEYGLRPLIVERGKEIEERVKDVERFWKERKLDPESNVQFGEGGAGTFSDGKLTTRVDDSRISYILETFVRAGADPQIAYLAKPHIGTDKLRNIVVNIRKLLIERGCELRFGAKVTGIEASSNKIVSVSVNDGEEIETDCLVLAIGHSARDTYRLLLERGVEMTSKAFAVGLRAEHPQPLIDKIQFGKCAGHAGLGSAEYAITHNMKERGRSAYSFCMCPGGMVVNASSEPAGLVVNGMSHSGRDRGYANSALIVNVTPEDFGKHALAGMEFQRKWERIAFIHGGGNYNAPAQNLMAFCEPGKCYSLNKSTFLPALEHADLSLCLPHYVTESLREALPVFDRKMRGFLSSESTLIGIETRTSAPLRILRGRDMQSVSIAGLYPCGEGAGYAGGIMSSALDGIKVADMIARKGQ
ncbi:MAG: FAD-dependent oxidoreductase [Deltaproteobacteria bacterium]|nr:FAD-dependent oxidoreductase [Deltaproteobacteria bacterium]